MDTNGFLQFTSKSGEIIYYKGNPDLAVLEELAAGPGDIWHSSHESGLKNVFPEIVYQTATFFWFLDDAVGSDTCVSWRIDPDHFAVRKSVWEQLGGFDEQFRTDLVKALDFGFHALRYGGAVPLYVKGLFKDLEFKQQPISREERYGFFLKNFKKQHAYFMLYRKGFWNLPEWIAFSRARKKYRFQPRTAFVHSKPLDAAPSTATVSYIIPTMNRQDYTLQLLDDLQQQTCLPLEVVVVDATRPELRDESLYDPSRYSFDLKVLWQETKGSCRARNEAIAVCRGEYIIFGDDDIRIPSDFVQNHLAFLKTNGVAAAAGLDIRADDYRHGLPELNKKLEGLGERRYLSGVTQIFSNSNACVRRDKVLEIGGNDINYDGGYGEDADFGLSLLKSGTLVLVNPYSVNLHLKPPAGGYRVWGSQAKVVGKKRKSQPWELDHPVKWLRPVPSPTVIYLFRKHFRKATLKEYKHKYFFLYLFKGSASGLPGRLFRLPYRILQFNKSLEYAERLHALGKRTE